MTPRDKMIITLLALLLPLLVAGFDLSLPAAILLVLGLLVLRQFLLLGSLGRPPSGAELELETLLQSHYAEKARWCLDRLGVDYRERLTGGVIGVFFTGRTVPRLNLRTGITKSQLCESSHILRYLYGRFAGQADVDTDFLAPNPERLDWEQRLDRYGRSQQVWIYHHLLKDPALCKEAWGSKSLRIPAWQRWTILACYPLLEILIRRAFTPDRAHYETAVQRTEEVLAATEGLLEDGRIALLGGDAIDFVDITLASLSALWLQPEQFMGGRIGADRLDPERMPGPLREDQKRWREQFPATTAHLERLFREERLPTSAVAGAAP